MSTTPKLPREWSDWRALPLAGDGRCLIEASAGTGKTWTIAVLYLRLLLECEWSPRQVVVTTFTIAAAQELRERLRERLTRAVMQAERAAAGAAVDASSTDAGDAWLRERWSNPVTPARIDLIRLRLAQAEFDLAPITTLHSLCRKILADFPFESGSAFGTGELVSTEALDRELRDDLWRRLVQSESDHDDGDRAWFDAGRKSLDAALRIALAPGVRVREIDADALNDVMRPECAVLLRAFIGDGDRFIRVNSALKSQLEDLIAFIDGGDPLAPLPDRLEKGIAGPLEKQFKAAWLESSCADPALAFAEHAFQVLARASAPARATALIRYREALMAQREHRLLARDQLTFDSLISRVRGALCGQDGGTLAARLFETWPVALVDEFQDTDAQQYAILDRIYGDDEGNPRGRLVMIGDPKQAIYRFRGGDIHAYLAAKKTATDRLTLDTNFRSSPGLVAAFNAFYAHVGTSMSQRAASEIGYENMSAAGNADDTPLTIDGMPYAKPLAFHLRADGDGNADERREAALIACAGQIAGMLQERRHRIGGTTLQPGDIAVLLPTNNDIARLRTLLAARGVPCVGAGKQSVFDTDSARDLLVLLYAIEHANAASAIRAALMTRFFGFTMHALHELADAPEQWERLARQFAAWKQQWRSNGVQAVVQSVIDANARAFVAAPDAERALTDVRHLCELLQEAGEHCDGPESLLAWFADQRGGDDASSEEAGDERQLRIESDARRVRLMTLHASKGLQFPVVMLPLMWAHSGRKITMPQAYDAATGMRLIDLGSADFDAAVVEDAFDDQDERFRVLYVAMTRAQHACHVYAFADGVDDAVDPKRSALSASIARIHQRSIEGEDAFAANVPVAWSLAGWPVSDATYRPDAAPMPPMRAARALPPTPPYESRYSFSALTRPQRASAMDDAAAGDEAPDAADEPLQSVVAMVDARADADEPAHPQLATLAAIKGAEFGNALHAIFELRKIGQPMAQQFDLIRHCLLDEGVRIDAGALDATIARIARRVQETLDAPLLRGADPSPALARLPATHLRAEMEFNYALGEVAMQRLRAACASHGEPDLVPRGSPQVLRGLMNGKIDLVFQHAGRFHVLDYKSNFLGEQLSAYAPDALRAEMDRHDYRFQALLYSVAVDRYLRQRVPGYRRSDHLGAAIYLFVRAVGLAPHSGIWAHRFDDALIVAVDDVLATAAHAEAA